MQPRRQEVTVDAAGRAPCAAGAVGIAVTGAFAPRRTGGAALAAAEGDDALQSSFHGFLRCPGIGPAPLDTRISLSSHNYC